MSDIPKDPPSSGEEIDLGEIEDGEDLSEPELEQEPGEDGEGPDGEADAEEGAGDEVEPPSRPRRKTEAQRWRERAERAERLAAEKDAESRGFRQAAEQFRAPVQGPSPAELAEAQRREDEQLALMSPPEISRYFANKQRQEGLQLAVHLQNQFRDELDKRDFERDIGSDRARRDAVEREYQAQRQVNPLVTRRQILFQQLGQETWERGRADAPRQRRVASQRSAAQQARPVNGRGDSAAARRGGTWGDPDFDRRMADEYINRIQGR